MPERVKVVVIEAGADHTDRLEVFEINTSSSVDETVAEAMVATLERGYEVMPNEDGGNCRLVEMGAGMDYVTVTVYPDGEEE